MREAIRIMTGCAQGATRFEKVFKKAGFASWKAGLEAYGLDAFQRGK